MEVSDGSAFLIIVLSQVLIYRVTKTPSFLHSELLLIRPWRICFLIDHVVTERVTEATDNVD